VKIKQCQIIAEPKYGELSDFMISVQCARKHSLYFGIIIIIIIIIVVVVLRLQHFVVPWLLCQFLSRIYRPQYFCTGISLSQGRYLHTGQHKHRIKANRHPYIEWDSNPRSKFSSNQRRFMSRTAWLL
jgi:hypothetical protein